MSYQSKKLWDEVLDNIDPKFANEAAELFGIKLGAEEDEDYGEPVRVEVRKLPLIQNKRRFVGGLVGSVAAAAVLAVSVGSAVRYVKKSQLVQSEPNESSMTDEVAIILKQDPFEDICLPDDPALYSEDYSVYEERFCGRWKQSAGSAGYYDARGQVYNVGYAPAENSLFLNRQFFEKIGFCKDEQGAYMAQFAYSDDGALSHAEIVFSPEDDRDTLCFYIVFFTEDEEPSAELERVYVRDGEYAEENVGALNYFGVRKLCGEMGIDPDIVYASISYDGDGLRLAKQGDMRVLISEGAVINYRGEDRLDYALKCAVVGNETAFYNISVKKENGKWGAPALADYTKPVAMLDSIPEKTDTADRDVLEEYFFGEWRSDGLLNAESTVGAPQLMEIMYSDGGVGETPEFVSVFRGDEGAFAYTAAGAVCFVPENDRQLMYYFRDGSPREYMIYRLSSCASAENRDLYGVLTELGRERLFDALGDGFEDTYNGFVENYQTAELNGDTLWLDLEGEPYFLCAEEIDGGRATLVHNYSDGSGKREISLASVFERADGAWDYKETYYDVSSDYTPLENESGENTLTVAEKLALYEEVFFGEWQCVDAGAYDEYIVISYSEQPYGIRDPYKGHDGYYMSRLNGGAFEMFFIPHADINSMYYYSEGIFRFDDSGNVTTLKRGYSQKFVRSSKPFDNELREMMPLSSLGLKKLCESAGGNFKEELDNSLYSSDYIIDKNGVSWKAGNGMGALNLPMFDPVLIRLSEDNIILSQTYFQPIPTEYDYSDYDVDSTFENGKLRNFIHNFTKQDGVWTSEISDAGETVNAVISFDMDMSVFPNFFGVWSDGEVSYTLDYYNDFCEAETSWIAGFAETDTMWMMKVHRVDRGESDVIPIKSGDAVYAIEKSEPDTVRIYKYTDALPEGEPLKTYTRMEKSETAFPDRGYISIYGLYALIDIIGDGGFENTVREYCFTGSVTAPDGRTLNADPSEISKPEYVILERNSSKVKLATTFYGNKAYDYVVTFANENGVNGGDNWHMSAYEPAIYGLADAEKIPLDNGSYYAFNSESDGTHLYFFDSSDGIIYELDESADGAVYALNGDDLFVLKPVDEECVLTRYLGGRYGGGCVPATLWEYPEIRELGELIPDFLEFKGDYLLAGFTCGEKRFYAVCLPYEADIAVLIETDYLEIVSNGFFVNEGEEVRFYDTERDSLQCVLPLLRNRASQAWRALAMDTDLFDPAMNRDFSLEKDGLTYYPASNPRFLRYADFEEYLKEAFTDELAAEMLASTNVITDNDGRLYAIAGGRGGDITIAEVKESEPELINENTAEIVVEVYRWLDDMSSGELKMGEEPDEVYSLRLEKTVNGWRFSDFREPY